MEIQPHLEQTPSLPNVERSPPNNAFEQAVTESIPETERVPGWFKRVVKTITDAWFDPDSFEQQPGFYEKFGIRTFKKYMPTSGDLVATLVWKKIGFIEDPLVRPNLASLKRMETFTRVVEAGHLAAFAVFAAGTGYALGSGDISSAAFGVGLNTLINIYPIMLQRYNRVRLYRTIRAIQRIESAKHPSTTPTVSGKEGIGVQS